MTTTTFSEADIKSMVAQVLGELSNGARPATTTQSVSPVGAAGAAPVADVEDTTPEHLLAVPNPANRDGYLQLMHSTPARIGEWRAGTRPTIKTLLRFRADHAGAMDAVFNDVDPDLVNQQGLFAVQSAAADKATYLMDPNIGATFTPETAKALSEHCTHGAQVQIIVADGLSSAAVEANIPDVLPALTQGLKRYNLTVGTNIFVKYGRVRIMDAVSEILGCEVALLLVGERPGLVTNESLSAYMTYKGHPGIAESSRTVVSNIYAKGTAPVEAGAYLADIAKKMIDTKTSGMDLKL